MKDNYMMIEGKEIALSEDTIKEIKSKLIKSRWGYNEGDTIYLLNKGGAIERNKAISNFTLERHTVNYFFMMQGNIFRTREEAEQERDRRSALQRIRKYIYENDLEFTPDWNTPSKKYYIYYNYDNNEFYVDWWTTNDVNSLFYFKSSKHTNQVINNCKDDLKVVFNIK